MAALLLEEYELLGDVRYRSYVSSVDKALKSFEYTSEWADLISALGKLNKVLLSHTKYQVIPRRITISKRLAQCMHPALPSGVHLKALETYDIIFKCIGSARLSQELFIYSAGLFPLLANAAMNVKPSLLSIYETHFIPLGEKLRPGLNGLLIGVLPGLDEGSDYYERTDILLQKICEGVEKSYFYGCLWKCILSNPIIRLPAISFITNHFSRKQSTEDQLYVIGTDIDSMVHGLCSSLQDNSVLVQRCALDLLLLGFPIHNNQLVAADMVHIVTAAVTVVLRRDMSLNRRLFSWLLGGDTVSTTEAVPVKIEPLSNLESNTAYSYFNTYSKDLLLEALQVCINNPASTIPAGTCSADLLLFRLLISLLDRPEISTIILDDILIEVFRLLYLRCHAQYVTPSYKNSPVSTNKNCAELIKTANLFFATLEPWYLWAYSAKLLKNACQRKPKGRAGSDNFLPKVGSGEASIIEMCTIIGFLLDVVSLETYLEAKSEHLPDLMCQIADSLSQNCEALTSSDMCLALHLCSKILSKVQAPMINVDEVDMKKKSFCASKIKAGSLCMKSLSIDAPVQNENSKEPHCDELKYDGHVSEYSNMNDLKCSVASQSQAFPPNLSTGITNCMEKYEKLLVNFLKIKMLCDSEKSLARFDSLLLPKQNGDGQREEKLGKILHTSLKAKCNCLTEREIEIFSQNIRQNLEPNQFGHLDEEVIPHDDSLSEAFSGLCHIIVELSSFPIYCTNSKKIFENNFSKLDTVHVPEWLKLLTSVACFGDWEEIVFTAMTTIFDLISLTQAMGANCEHSHMSLSSNSSGKSFSTSQTVVSVVSIPIMTSSQLVFLSEETALYKIAATKLWKYVGDPQPHLCLRGSELIQKVHNLSLASSVCEAVICDSMSSGSETEQLHSQKKFCVLWHLTRNLGLKSTPPASVKAFDQCFFWMLDNLGKKTGPQKAIAQSWLNHSLQRGDIARFMEPILMILLHPDSARVSVQHVNVHSPKKVTITDENKAHNSEEFEAKIYAISSISGNIIYHVSDDSYPSSQHVSPQKKILALTSVVNLDGSKVSEVVTEKLTLKEFDHPSSHERDLRVPISVFVNPFGSLSSLCSDSQVESLSNTPDISQAMHIRQKYSFEQDDDVVSPKPVVSYTRQTSGEEIVAKIVDEILDHVVKSVGEGSSEIQSSSSSGECSIVEEDNFENQSSAQIANIISENSVNESKQNVFTEVTVHPIHSYMLLYCQVYDSKKTLYALNSLKSIILTNPRITLCSMATTNISNSLSFRGQQLQFLLARHRKSVFGNNFHGELSAEGTTMYRSSTFVETVILSCLYHIRSYYPNLPMMKLTNEEVLGNREVRLLCMDVLTLLFSELVAIVKDSGKNFATYLNDLLSRSKVQKTLLHCLVACVFDSQNVIEPGKKVSFTEVIVEFNDKDLNSDLKPSDRTNDFQDTFQVHLLQLIATLIVIEDTISGKTTAEKDSRSTASKSFEFTFDRSSHLHNQSHITSMKYQQGLPIAAQPMFLNAVLTALDYQHNKKMHIHWLSLVTSALPFAGRWLSRLVMTVIIQLCFNLENIAAAFNEMNKSEENSCQSCDEMLPPDYLITIIEGLTTLCHYCLLECPPITNLFNPSLLQPVTSQPYDPGTSTSQIISNLIHVFSTSSNEKEHFANNEPSTSVDPILSARRALLSNLPRIISSLSSIYHVTTLDKISANEACWVIGTPKVVKQHILSFLSPISLNYGTNFIGALAVIWHEQRSKGLPQSRKVIPAWSTEQLLLVDLLAAIKVLPIESIVQTVRNVLKQPPPISQKNKVPLEVCTLQLFLAYIQNTPDSYLVESWQSLLCLWRDGLQVSSPPVQFHLLSILHEFVQRAPILEDKKSQKDLQDITHKLIEACSSVARASLEQTTWLWRNLAVRPGPQTDILAAEHEREDGPEELDSHSDTTSPVNEAHSNNDDAQYSVQALTILAEFLAPVLDFVYIGEEKDKVVPLLSNIMYYVTPYLKDHSSHNAPSFRACCQLLSSISGYQHTRKAWRKDAFDLLLDMSFFQMPPYCITYWRSIVDHLMTHDKTTFRDFMARVSVAQAGSLNLFSSKEQEYEQRANLLKRLAFVLFCSEIDQYQKYMPDIQERLTDCLRLHQVPSVHAEVFLCFRVLLIRMSPLHVTSLWPVIITEMVQIFTQIEYELCADSDEFSCGGGLKKITSSHLRRLSTLESSWVTNTVNGLNAHNHPAWLHLHLSVCKLLDMAVALPANVLPQFQMYRWAFVGDSPPLSSESLSVQDKLKSSPQEFVPHVARLARLLNKKEQCKINAAFVPGQLLITAARIQTIQELQPFFNALSDISCKRTSNSNTVSSLCFQDTTRKAFSLLKCRSAPELQSLDSHQGSFFPHIYRTKTLEQIEIVLENDFIETPMN